MKYRLMIDQESKIFDAKIKDGQLEISSGEKIYAVSFAHISEHELLMYVDGNQINAFVCEEQGRTNLIVKGQAYTVREADHSGREAHRKTMRENSNPTVSSPMPAVVISLLAKVGDTVEKGQGLVVVSAMKMETTLSAPFNGTVMKVNAGIGDKVMPGEILVDIQQEEECV